MELAANQSKTMSQSGTIQAFVKDCSVHEATAAAPCDILLKVRRIKIHLLTYTALLPKLCAASVKQQKTSV